VIHTPDIFPVIQSSSLDIYAYFDLKTRLIQKSLNGPLEKGIVAQGAERRVDR
jgi:hypothetical protein